MTFDIKFHPQVDKFLKKCEKELSERIKAKIRLLKEKPFDYLDHYEGDFYKLRVGNYRALIDVDTQRKFIFVRYLDHRSRVYKRKISSIS